ncbi:MAG: ComF family protein [Zoogloeaceae bacterium]|jgi:ComF family protein|nr:ComF family protein [Zoogloeaceae bacterium]
MIPWGAGGQGGSRFWKPLVAAAQRGLDALLPSACLLCGAACGAEPVCADCRAELPALPPHHCPICLEATPYGERCGACLAHPLHFSELIALYAYAFPLDRLVLALKYEARFALARWWAEMLATRLAANATDAILPVPLHPERLAERGYNQAEILARPLARALRLPLLADVLEKSRATPQQSASDREARRKNLRNAFTLRPQALPHIRGKRLLLVDDVLTTGATLDEIARLLLRHGAAEIRAATVARTLKAGVFV